MNKKTKTAFVCNQCGQEFAKWQGRCTSCNAWESIVEFKVPSGPRSPVNQTLAPSEVVTLDAFVPKHAPRLLSGFPEIDRVLGGGFVPGAFLLIGGDPGIGKSTLLLQVLCKLSSTGKKCLYVTGEESDEQISLRADRLGLSNAPLSILAETNVQTIVDKLGQTSPNIVVIDSIQTMYISELDSAPGSVSQLRECAAVFLQQAKKTNTIIILIGHVTKEGAIAGPRLLEHMVDAVVYFEGDSHYQYRILRSVKNRYGPSGEIAIFAMSDKGLAEVDNPSDFFCSVHAEAQIGTAIAPAMEGSRALIIELQALVNRSHFGIPQRVASGINQKKLSLLLAVIERHGGIILGDHDIFFNITGGLAISEPAIDVAVCAAILSSFRNRPLAKGIAFIGEVGLGGELRPVNGMDKRLKELARLGFTMCVIAPLPKKVAISESDVGIKIITVKKIGDLQDVIF